MLCALTVDRRAIVGIEAASGRSRWRTSVEDIGSGFVEALRRDIRGRVVGQLQVVDRMLVAGVHLHHVAAIDSMTGEIRWTSKVPMAMPVNCMATAGRIDAISNSKYVSLDPATGRVAREESVTAESGAGIDPGYLESDGRTLYAAEESGTVFAFDTVDGRLRWTHALGARVPLALPPALGLGRLFVTDYPKGRLHAFVL